MPKNEQVITVFVASPNDMGEEREILERTIRELNVAWSRDQGIRLDLVRWETHAFPAAGIDPQAIINDQIGDDYDVFIGIMWQRFGTPTGRAGSGTQEEFERAKAKFDADSNSVSIMMYFKDEPISPTSSDFEQIILVNKFRKNLKQELYWLFKSATEFESLVRLHLVRQIQIWRERPNEIGEIVATSGSVLIIANSDGPEDEAGLLDLLDTYEDNFEQISGVMEKILQAMDDLTTVNTNSAAALVQIQGGSSTRAGRNEAKSIIAAAADNMEDVANTIRDQMVLYSEKFDAGMRALIGAVEVSTTMPSDTQGEDRAQLKQKMDELDQSISTAMAAMSGLRDSVSGLPRMTSDLNRAKRKLGSELVSLLSRWEDSRRIVGEALMALRPVS